MTKNMKRAIRRHHVKRLNKKRKGYWSGILLSQEHNALRWCGMITKTPKPCSCHMCGNPRKYFNERTMQEKKSDAALIQDIADLQLKKNRPRSSHGLIYYS